MVPATTIRLDRPVSPWASRDKGRLLNRSISCEEQDLELVRRVGAGDNAALRALYTAYGQRLYAYAVRLTRHPTIAEDVLQESMVAAWQGAAGFRGEGRVIAWLLGIVHHKALNAIRRKSPALMEEEQEELPAGGTCLDEQMAGDEQAELLRRGLESLSLKHRMALELVFYQGLNLNEVAAVCSCPVGTVKSRLNYAKAHLRRVLEQAGLRAEDLQP
jgi:RNA polymerase sigma-70 factor (ECF subfamily)